MKRVRGDLHFDLVWLLCLLWTLIFPASGWSIPPLARSMPFPPEGHFLLEFSAISQSKEAQLTQDSENLFREKSQVVVGHWQLGHAFHKNSAIHVGFDYLFLNPLQLSGTLATAVESESSGVSEPEFIYHWRVRERRSSAVDWDFYFLYSPATEAKTFGNSALDGNALRGGSLWRIKSLLGSKWSSHWEWVWSLTASYHGQQDQVSFASGVTLDSPAYSHFQTQLALRYFPSDYSFAQFFLALDRWSTREVLISGMGAVVQEGAVSLDVGAGMGWVVVPMSWRIDLNLSLQRGQFSAQNYAGEGSWQNLKLLWGGLFQF